MWIFVAAKASLVEFTISRKIVSAISFKALFCIMGDVYFLDFRNNHSFKLSSSSTRRLSN